MIVQNFELVVRAIPKGDPIALAEVQQQINGPRFSYSFPGSGRFTSIVMRFDEVAGDGRQFYHQRLDFEDTRSVMVGRNLHAFKFDGPVKAYKYTEFNNTQLLRKTTLATPPHNGYLKDFSVTNMANTLIVLTGGRGDDNIASAKTLGLIVKTEKW